MKILITNDDGYKYEALELLVTLSQKYGEVYVVAPKNEQSAKSHSINIREGFEVERINDRFIVISSTTADCVRYAHYHEKLDFDIVFSGINKGYNAGEDIMYSGTVAGVIEAGFINKQGIAFSSSVGGHHIYEKYFDVVMDYILKNNLLEISPLLNVNIPNNPKGIKITYQGRTSFDTYFEEINGVMYQRGNPHFELEDDENTDVYAIKHEYISISPLSISKIDMESYKKMTHKK